MPLPTQPPHARQVQSVDKIAELKQALLRQAELHSAIGIGKPWEEISWPVGPEQHEWDKALGELACEGLIVLRPVWILSKSGKEALKKT